MAVDWSIPHWRQRGRRTTARARRLGAILAPEMASSTKLSRLPVANQVFLGSWMVDICQEGHSQRTASQRRHMAHLRRHSRFAHRKLSCWDQGGDKTHLPTWGECTHQAPGLLSCSNLGWHKRQAQLSLCLCGVPENLSSLDLGSACNPGPALNTFPEEQPGT